MRTQRNAQFNNRQHFVNYCRKIATGKMGYANHVGCRQYTNMLRQIWQRQNPEEIENFIYKLKKATPEQLEISLRRLRGAPKERTPFTGMYGIWSAVSKEFVFGIQEPSKTAARRKLHSKIGNDAHKYRFTAKKIRDCAAHREMLKVKLKFKEEVEVAE